MEFRSPQYNTTTDSVPVSHHLPTVVLQKWWLIKTDDKVSHRKRLGVAGFSSRDMQAVRAFSSAPIEKSHDLFTLETVDGITIVLKGLIDRIHTTDNGFPVEVFRHFVLGFPPYWESYTEKFLLGESGDDYVSRCTAASEELLADSVGLADFQECPPNTKREAISKLRNTNCDNVDLSQVGEGAGNAKRIIRSSSKISDTDQCVPDSGEATPNKKKNKIIRPRNANSGNVDLSQAGERSGKVKRILRSSGRIFDTNQCVADSREATLDEKINEIIKPRSTNSENVDLSQAGEGSGNAERMHTDSGRISDTNQCFVDSREATINKRINEIIKPSNTISDNVGLSQAGEGSGKAERILRSSARISDTNQCLDSFQDCTPNNGRKHVQESRSASCDKNSTQAGKERKNAKRVHRSCSKGPDSNQQGAFHTEYIKKKSNARGEANSSQKNTRTKQSYVKSHAAKEASNKGSPASPQFSSVKKSRSGRKLLRPLEFWRNETAVYDWERELTRIKSLSPNVNLSGG